MTWKGAAAVCVNGDGQLLMVLQGTPEEEKKWAVPCGGLEKGESFEACCLRELNEETGFEGSVVRPLFHKKNEEVDVRYYEVMLTGGCMTIDDPDGLIHEVAWKGADEMAGLILSFPEDRDLLDSILSLISRQPI
ncbi:NUDIX hydrolase [Edaphobacillus lindanitolerans]|uniref:Aminoglycoside 6'-N-acetyltransferase n=1 Tax=Edaphobacillus lindanitolerans TaxID=550447 RepID=A0A1U7PLX0_9BACI|nr:NUDIX hydrolase [Edaphobacillus lindanitolerans]SIT75695.1 aminoglycoside 6'-N-acetyltransferase [Edaphobacillus lindanitolerans]